MALKKFDTIIFNRNCEKKTTVSELRKMKEKTSKKEAEINGHYQEISCAVKLHFSITGVSDISLNNMQVTNSEST